MHLSAALFFIALPGALSQNVHVLTEYTGDSCSQWLTKELTVYPTASECESEVMFPTCQDPDPTNGNTYAIDECSSMSVEELSDGLSGVWKYTPEDSSCSGSINGATLYNKECLAMSTGMRGSYSCADSSISFSLFSDTVCSSTMFSETVTTGETCALNTDSVYQKDFCEHQYQAPSEEGACFSGESTVEVASLGQGSTEIVKLADLEEGRRVLAVTSDHRAKFAEVRGLFRSPGSAPYLHIAVSGLDGAAHKLEATEYHTFPVCDSASDLVPANKLSVGQCVHTIHGPAKISSITRVPATIDDTTYSIVLEGETDLIAVGGVFTHTRASSSHRGGSAPVGMGAVDAVASTHFSHKDFAGIAKKVLRSRGASQH